MAILKRVLEVLGLATLLLGSVGATEVPSAFPTASERQIWFRHLKPLPDSIKTAGLHIVVPDAPTMSARLTELFRQAGYNMVPVDQATHRYELRGAFQSEGRMKVQVPLGIPLEAAATGVAATASGMKRTEDVLVASIVAEQAVKSGLTTPVWASGDLLRAVLQATGVSDALNTALTGDRRGWCLGDCTYWEWSDQRVGLGWRDPRTKGAEGMSSVDVGVFAKGLFVEELTTLALNEFLRHHGVIQASEPRTDALMPRERWPVIVKGRMRATIKMLEP